MRIVIMACLLLSPGARAETRILNDENEILGVVRSYGATILFLGYGSRTQYAHLEEVYEKVDRIGEELNAKYGMGHWLAVFGGDPFEAGKPDLAYVIRRLKEKHHAPILAVRVDGVKGMEPYFDYEHYVARHVVDSPQGKHVVYGGFGGDGRPVGPTAIYLGPGFIGGPKPLLTGVIAVGGGPLAAEESRYAVAHEIPFLYIAARAKYHAPDQPEYGPLHAWARTLECRGIFEALAARLTSP